MKYLSVIEIARYVITIKSKISGEDNLTISRNKLQCLLYYVKGYTLAITNKELFKEKIIAYQDGVKIKEIENYFKDSIIELDRYKMTNYEIKTINKKLRKLIEMIFNLMGQYEPYNLLRRVKQEYPWMSTYDLSYKDTIIPECLLRQYFRCYIN